MISKLGTSVFYMSRYSERLSINSSRMGAGMVKKGPSHEKLLSLIFEKGYFTFRLDKVICEGVCTKIWIKQNTLWVIKITALLFVITFSLKWIYLWYKSFLKLTKINPNPLTGKERKGKERREGKRKEEEHKEGRVVQVWEKNQESNSSHEKRWKKRKEKGKEKDS